MKVTAIIPTLNPTKRILSVVWQLYKVGFTEIIIVDDGSDESCQPIFKMLKENWCCTVLTHACNEGKGQALKTAFNQYLASYEDQIGVVTLDDDGQHGIDNVAACAKALEEGGDALILGVRNFDGADVPSKSRFGNKLTSAVFAFSCGLHISDTQTGLRAIPNRWIPVFAEISGKRFEYETNMLLAAKEHGIPIREVPIQTIYSENNKGTHFRPFVDSLRIYQKLLRFMASSLTSFLVDILAFWLMCRLPLGDTVSRVFWATLVSRAASSAVNFLLNRQVVFRQDDRLLHSAARYYLLCAAQALASFLLVGGLGILSAGRWLVPLKMLVDGMLFLLSYQVQQRWVFRPKKQEEQTV